MFDDDDDVQEQSVSNLGISEFSKPERVNENVHDLRKEFIDNYSI